MLFNLLSEIMVLECISFILPLATICRNIIKEVFTDKSKQMSTSEAVSRRTRDQLNQFDTIEKEYNISSDCVKKVLVIVIEDVSKTCNHKDGDELINFIAEKIQSELGIVSNSEHEKKRRTPRITDDGRWILEWK